MTEVKGGRGPAARRAVVERRPVGVRRERGIDLGTEPRAAPWAGTAIVGAPLATRGRTGPAHGVAAGGGARSDPGATPGGRGDTSAGERRGGV